MIITTAWEEQLRQIASKSPHPGVYSGDLINKPVARALVDAGLVWNSGGASASLGYLTISRSGADLLRAIDEINAKYMHRIANAAT